MMQTKQKIVLNAAGQSLGRVASKAARYLMGKELPSYKPYNPDSVNVEIYNVSRIRLTGNKESDKKYKRYSGYPGGLKYEDFKKARAKDPSFPLRKAISGMLPSNKLKKSRLQRLTIHENGKDSD